jgi:hypothetical protein
VRLVFELAVGEAQSAVAGARETSVTGAIVLESLARLVVAPAVGFDDEAVVGEEEVDLLAANRGVDARCGEAVVPAEAEEDRLEVAPRQSVPA